MTSNLSLYNSTRQTVDVKVTGGVDSYSSKDRVISPATGYTEAASFGALAGTIFNSDGAHPQRQRQRIDRAPARAPEVHRADVGRLPPGASRGEHHPAHRPRRDLPDRDERRNGGADLPDQTLGLSRDFAIFAQEEFFTLNDRLLVTAGVNAEKSSSNGDQEKYYAYPKFSASYRRAVAAEAS